MALAGAVIYPLEWVGIIGFNTGDVPAAQGAKPAEILARTRSTEQGSSCLPVG